MIWTFTKRNLKIFFRDKTAVFFSFFSAMIILALYVLFLGDMMKRGFTNEVPFSEVMVDAWLIAGLVCVTTVTSVLGVFGNRVMDIQNKITKDFTASPAKQSHITFGYLLSSFIVGVILSGIVFAVGFLYMLTNGAEFYSLMEFLRIFFYIIVSLIGSAAMIFFIITFVRSENAFGTVSSIVGTLIGFLAGIYIPIGNLPSSVGIVIKLFPPAHAASLIRQAMMERYIPLVFSGAPAEAAEEFGAQLGVYYSIGSFEITPLISVLYVLIFSLLFFGLSIISLKRKQK